MKLWRVMASGVLALVLSACSVIGPTKVSKTEPTEYTGAKTSSGMSLSEELRAAAPKVNPKVVFTIGGCVDKTGKYLDQDQLRYSRAVTQACADILQNYVRMAGFNVVERDPYNLGLIAQEYKMSHEFNAASARSVPPKNIGLVQKGGPDGGLVGANYLITGAVSMYSSSTSTGGGGVDVDAIGFSTKYSVADVGMVLRIVDISTGLIVSSLALNTRVEGRSFGFHITRFFGSVASTIATISDSGATSLLAPKSSMHVASAELGAAYQLPIDYAVNDVIVASLARQFEANQRLFYSKPVHFKYDIPAGN